MIKLAGAAVCCLFCAVLLRDKNRLAAAAVSVGGALLILYGALSDLREIIARVEGMIGTVAPAASWLKLMLKVLGITLLTQLISDLCRDNGENALASVTETAAKILVIILVLPLFETVISIVGGLVK